MKIFKFQIAVVMLSLSALRLKSQVGSIDTLLKIAYAYDKAYTLENIYDPYIVNKLETYYLEVLKTDTLNGFVMLKITSLYYSKYNYYNYLVLKTDMKKNRKLAKNNYEKASFYNEKMKKIIGKSYKLEFLPN